MQIGDLVLYDVNGQFEFAVIIGHYKSTAHVRTISGATVLDGIDKFIRATGAETGYAGAVVWARETIAAETGNG